MLLRTSAAPALGGGLGYLESTIEDLDAQCSKGRDEDACEESSSVKPLPGIPYRTRPVADQLELGYLCSGGFRHREKK